MIGPKIKEWTYSVLVDSLLLGGARPESCEIGPFGTGSRLLLLHSALERCRREMAERRVVPLALVECLDEVEHRRPRLADMEDSLWSGCNVCDALEADLRGLYRRAVLRRLGSDVNSPSSVLPATWAMGGLGLGWSPG